MVFADRILTCKDCNEEFLFTAGEQDFTGRRAYRTIPGRCPDCRNKRKQQAIANNLPSVSAPGALPVVMREVSKVTCAECGRETTVPFRPRLARPVYCSECFTKQREAEALAAAEAVQVAQQAELVPEEVGTPS